MLLKNLALCIFGRIGRHELGEPLAGGVDHRNLALSYSGDDEFVVGPNADHCVSRHVVDVARTDPPFFPHGSDLMCCGACGLVMGQDRLIQIAHIGWHERGDR